MTKLTYSQANEIWLDSPVLRPFREPKYADDWGDQETIGVNLKRHNYNIMNDKDFGIYLGKHDIGFVVGIKNWTGGLTGGEAYNTLEALKQIWVID